MTTASYALGRPRHALSRGGDCRAFDLSIGRKVQGMHRFESPDHCQIVNGMIRTTVGPAGVAPRLTFDVWRGATVVGDYYSDTYSDTYPGTLTTKAWFAMGAITIDSPSVSAVLTGVQIAVVSDEAVVIRLIAPAIGDAWVVLDRGMRHCYVQHGRTRGTVVNCDRRIRLTDSPSPTGSAATQRVEELSGPIDGMLRFVAALDPVTVDSGAFSLTADDADSFRFGFGVGTSDFLDDPAALHSQLGDTSLPSLVVTADA